MADWQELRSTEPHMALVDQQLQTLQSSRTFERAEQALRLLRSIVDGWRQNTELTDEAVRQAMYQTSLDTTNARALVVRLRGLLEKYYLGTLTTEPEGRGDAIVLSVGPSYRLRVWRRPVSPAADRDILATFRDLPERRIRDHFDHGAPQRVRVCVTGVDGLRRWQEPLTTALRKGTTAEFLLGTPTSEFVRLREQSRRSNVTRLIRSNTTVLTAIREESGGQLELRFTDQSMPVSYLQIDDSIYVSAFWNSCAIVNGPHWLVAARSILGVFLVNEFQLLWETATRHVFPGTRRARSRSTARNSARRPKRSK